MSLRSTIATPEGKRRYVRRLFATIAHRYDFITGCALIRRDRRWKERLISLAQITSDDDVLDLAVRDRRHSLRGRPDGHGVPPASI
jgi:hypothetical protein